MKEYIPAAQSLRTAFFRWHGAGGLFLLGVASLLPYVGFASELSSKEGILRHEACFACAFALFAVSVLLGFRLPAQEHRRSLIVIFFFALLLRGRVVFTDPPRTTDVYRYLWEGKMTAHGINPFLHPPNDPALAPYRDEIYENVNNKSVPTVYPATSQMVFAFAYRLKPNSVPTLKLVLSLFDLGTIGALCGLLSALGLPLVWCVVYAWHPLVITELSLNGHQDGIGVFFLVLSLYFFVRQRPVLSGVSLALSVMAKGYSFLALPLLALGFLRVKAVGKPVQTEEVEQEDNPDKRSPASPHDRPSSPVPACSFLISFLLVSFLLVCRLLSWEGAWLKGMRQYLEHWERNAGIYFVLRKALEPFEAGAASLLHQLGLRDAPNLSDMYGSFAPLAKSVSAALLLIVLVLTLRNFPRDSRGAIGRTFILLAAFFMLSPTVYPWYLCWTIPFLCLLFSPTWFLFTGLVIMSYLYRWFGDELAWIRFIEYVPLWIGLVAEGMLRRNGGSRRSPPQQRTSTHQPWDDRYRRDETRTEGAGRVAPRRRDPT